MMYHFTIPMALMDFVPVLCFGSAAAILQRDLHDKMRKSQFALFAAGTVNIFAAGLLKDLWKLLYAAGLCDFAALNAMFLPLQSLGFLLAGIGIAWMMTGKRVPVLAVAPPVFSGSVIFICMMVLGLGSVCTVLGILAVKLGKKWAAGLFVLSFLCSMGMGAMASQDATQAWVNWAEQTINCVSQGLLLWGVIVLDKAGLENMKN